MFIKITQFMTNATVFETVLRGIAKRIILAKSQSAIFTIMLNIGFFT